MRGLPLVMTQGRLLAQVISDCRQDPRRHGLCACCGAAMLIAPDRAEQTVRCPGCLRVQRVALTEEAPWRLSPAAAERLRRTRTWLR